MNICEAMEGMKRGAYYRRPNWPGITYLYLDGEIFMYSSLRIDKPWVPSHIDLQATDWEDVIPDR